MNGKHFVKSNECEVKSKIAPTFVLSKCHKKNKELEMLLSQTEQKCNCLVTRTTIVGCRQNITYTHMEIIQLLQNMNFKTTIIQPWNCITRYLLF